MKLNKCPQCNKVFEGRKNKLYCSSICREKYRYYHKRKGDPKFKKLQNKITRRWYYNGGKEIKLKYHRSKRFRDYQNKWRRDKKYWLEQYEKNPPLNRDKTKRYRKTLKGKLTTLKYNERRRKKILLLTEKRLEKLDQIFLKKIRKRDRTCVYCCRKFNNKIQSLMETIDHFNCNEPLSEDNAVRCCWSCNSSKRNVPLEKIPEWIKRKKLTPKPIVWELLNKKIK